MVKNSQSWAILSISGKEHPDLISRKLNLEPDFFQTFDMNIKKTEYDKNVWQIYSDLAGNLSLEDHIWSLLKRIAPSRKIIKNISETAEVVIYCSVEFAGENFGGVRLAPRLLLLTGSLGISLEFIPWKNERIKDMPRKELE